MKVAKVYAMGFRLRGGRPKNMRQGIYWVQRARTTGRSRASSELSALRFNNRYNRITSQFLSIFKPYAEPSGTIEVVTGSQLDRALDRYNGLKSWIDANIDSATNGDLSKLVTAAKNILVEIAKRELWDFEWDASAKILHINESRLDFG